MITNRTSFLAIRGFSLVELMVALAIGLLIVGAAGTLYVTGKTSSVVQQGASRLQESARLAADALYRSISATGRLGCNSSSVGLVNMVNNSATPGVNYDYDFVNPIVGYNGSGANWLPALPGALPIAPLAGTDVLTVRRMNGPPVQVTAAVGPALALPIGANNFQLGDFVLVTDCAANVIVQKTNATGDLTLEHEAGGGTPGNSTGNFGRPFTWNLAVGNYLSNAEVTQLITETFYIALSGRGAPAAGELPVNALWVFRNGTSQELVRGVDDLQILFGEDTDAVEDGTINRYVTANNVTNMNRVIALKVELVLSSVDNRLTQNPQPYSYYKDTTLTQVTPPTNDRRYHTVVSNIIALRNNLRQ